MHCGVTISFPGFLSILQIISFTDGSGARGYTSLSPAGFGRARGLAVATNLLPFFAGRGQILAQRYNDRVVSSAAVKVVPMIIYLFFILLMGLIAGLFVPRLPLNVPRRGFELFTWMTVFNAGELTRVPGTGSGEDCEPGRSFGEKSPELDEVERKMGEMKFRYVSRQMYQ